MIFKWVITYIGSEYSGVFPAKSMGFLCLTHCHFSKCLVDTVIYISIGLKIIAIYRKIKNEMNHLAIALRNLK